MAHFLRQLGVLRLLLAFLALGIIAVAIEPGTAAVYEGRELFTTVISAVLAPLVFMVLMLDTLMSWVFMLDKQGEERRRYITALSIDLLLAAGIVFRWLPYYLALGK